MLSKHLLGPTLHICTCHHKNILVIWSLKLVQGTEPMCTSCIEKKSYVSSNTTLLLHNHNTQHRASALMRIWYLNLIWIPYYPISQHMRWYLYNRQNCTHKFALKKMLHCLIMMTLTLYMVKPAPTVPHDPHLSHFELPNLQFSRNIVGQHQ